LSPKKNKQKQIVKQFVYRGSQSHCAAEKHWRYTVLPVGKSHARKEEDDCMTPVTQFQHLQSPYYQPSVLYIHSLTLTH